MSIVSMPAIGDQFSDADLFDISDKSYKLSDFLDKKLLIEFWSVTCLTCMQIAPELSRLHGSYSHRINIVGINCDTTKAQWESGTERDGVAWANLSDLKGNEGIAGKYGVFAFPVFYIIGEDGKILDRWMGFKPGRVEEKVKDILDLA